MKENNNLKKIQKLKLLHYISVEMNKTHSTKELLEIILDRCIELTNAKAGSVMLINENYKVLDIVAYRGIPGDIIKKTKLKVGEGITGWVAQTGTPKIVGNAGEEPIYVRVHRSFLSELAVPIETEGKIIGVISVDSDKENAFNQEDLELLSMVAELSAQILLKEEMQKKLELKIKSQEILIQAFNIIEKEENLSEIFHNIMDILKEKIGILRGLLALFDFEKKDSLKIHCGYKISKEAMEKGIYKIGEGVIGSAVLEGKTIAIKDISKDNRFLNKMKIKRGKDEIISFIASPIKIDNTVLGVLAIEKKYEDDKNFDDTVNTLILLTSLTAYKVRSYQLKEEETKKLLQENIELRKELKNEYNIKNIIGKNEKLRNIIEKVKTISNTSVPVLITGETGTGKELIAKAIHFLSERRDKQFVSINCAAIPENLLESELFGYKKGAFTGAVSNKKGKFEIASGGTLFLDEIGDLPINLQAKLLRVIQEQEIQPLGGEENIKIDVRIIAATNKNLKNLVNENKFRSDLFFRLNVVNIYMPSLRDRKDDIPLLVEFFIKKYNKVYNKNIIGVSKAVLNKFLEYAWPGNIRELENIIERGVILSQGNIIDENLLKELLEYSYENEENNEFKIDSYIENAVVEHENDLYDKIINNIEKILIEKILIKTNYNKSLAAKILGITRNTLKAKIKEYGIG